VRCEEIKLISLTAAYFMDVEIFMSNYLKNAALLSVCILTLSLRKQCDEKCMVKDMLKKFEHEKFLLNSFVAK
jgi:hypothetical protein